MNGKTHTFELSALGKAPFYIVDSSDGNHAFYCEHCGTMLKHRFFVKSADGKVSVVGSECIKKTDDQGLIDGVKRIKKAQAVNAKATKQAEKRETKLEIERKQFNGKTHEEVRQEYLAKINKLTNELKSKIESHQLHDELIESDFGASIMEKLSNGSSVSCNVKRILSEILAKSRSGSRKNSKAYKDALPTALDDLEKLMGQAESWLLKIEQTKQDMYSHNSKYL
ncbi:conserved hypothetical protein [Vibrio chagasii]|nr:conserved hypothetical protein [Vibrio chagasii]